MEFLEDGQLELYNLQHDIGETKNLAESMPDKTRELHEKLIAWRKSVNAPMPTKNEDIQLVEPKKTKQERKKAKAD